MRKKLHFKKINFYSKYIRESLYPTNFWINKSNEILKKYDISPVQAIEDRVNYNFKYDEHFNSKNLVSSLNKISIFEQASLPTIDLINSLRYFDKDLQFNYNFNDNIIKPEQPTIVKCRPILVDNRCFTLMKLNSVRFFEFPDDTTTFQSKKSKAVFRGPCHRVNRQEFLKQCYGLQNTDIGDTRTSERTNHNYRPFMSAFKQLKFKFIISVEGNDVASNLPWIMASNSLAFMTMPRYEGWFMQGKLIPNYHYVLLKDDYSDLEEKIDYYSSNEDAALYILNNAKNHIKQFLDNKNELIISLLVLRKYFKNSCQI